MTIGEFELNTGLERGLSTSVLEELLDNGAGYASGPERGLLSALLFDGVQSFISYMLATSTQDRTKYAEAHNWVMEKSSEYAFSFVAVCEGLGINPDYLRLGLINASVSLLESVSKARRNC